MVTLPIPLPTGYTLKIQPGDAVRTGDVLAEKAATQELEISIPKILHIPIKHSARALRKNPGDAVAVGTVLASKKKAFGMSEDIILSQVAGIFLRYERDTGTIVLIPGTDAEDTTASASVIYSPIDGIVEVCDNGKILLRTDKDIIVGKEGIGEDFTGNVLSILQSQEDPEGKVQLHFLDSKIIGSIIIGGVFDRDSLLKAIGMGVGGIVAYAIREEDLSYIQARNLTTPIVTVEKEDYVRLLSWNSKKVYIQGEQKTILLLHL